MKSFHEDRVDEAEAKVGGGEPTSYLRFVHRVPRGKILQQRWITMAAEFEWRDVPLEEE